MRKIKRALLTQAKYDSVFSNVFPAGIGYLAEFLDSKGIETDVFDLNVSRNTEDNLHEKIRSFKPGLVGFSMMSLNYKYNYGVMERLKKSFPDVVIAAGGAHISTVREEALKECGAIDYGVTLEGEWTSFELLEGKNPFFPTIVYGSQGAPTNPLWRFCPLGETADALGEE